MSEKLVLILSLFILLPCLLPIRFNRSEVKAPNGYSVHNLNTGLNYTSIQEAINAPETLDGHTIFLEKGIYYEHLLVNKAILLIGENREAAILDGDGIGTVVLVQSSAVISDFTIRNGYIGIALVSSSSGRIYNNVIQNNNQGIYLFHSNNWNISENFITNNYYTNIILNNSNTNTIDRNLVSYNHLYPSGAVCLFNSSYNNINGNTIINNEAKGIQLNDHSSHNNISNNLLINNLGGIQLVRSCNYNIVKHNGIRVNETAWGLTSSIWIRESKHNTVCSNVIKSNRVSPAYKPPYQDGIGLSKSKNNSIIGNTISLMDVGIGFHFSADNNSIIDNIITRNGHGIDFSEGCSNGNIIYSNNFIRNAKQVYNKLSTNIWDNDHIVGGNYWSDYNGTDSNHDGIGHAPYLIDANNMDNYPLIGIFSSFNTSPGIHVNVISNSTIEDFHYFESNSTIKMYVCNMTTNQTYGFCRICISYELMNVTNISVIIDDDDTEVLYPNYALHDNGTHRWIYFAYEHSTHEIVMIPEFALMLILPLFMIATLLSVIVYRRKHTSKL